MRAIIRIAMLMPLCAMSVSACASANRLPSASSGVQPTLSMQQARMIENAKPTLTPVTFVQSLPMPSLPKIESPTTVPIRKAPTARVNAANLAALQEPTTDDYVTAIQIYPYSDGALYRLYAAPQEVSDIALQAGENLTAISAGDTTRWVVGDTTSGSGANKQVHILAKPFAANLKTNLVITTDRRTYHLQLESTAHTYMAALSWTYPEGGLIVKNHGGSTAAPTSPTDAVPSLDNLHFDYAISGDNPPWKPLRAFDDGTHVYIEFPKTIDRNEAPPLFVAGAGDNKDLVNYRVHGDYYIVDQLFAVAELRLGQSHQQVVRIKRTAELRTASANSNQQTR